MKLARASRGLLAVAAFTMVAVAVVVLRDRPPVPGKSNEANAAPGRGEMRGDEAPVRPLSSGEAETPKKLLPAAGATADPAAGTAQVDATPVQGTAAVPQVAKKEPYRPGFSKFKNAKEPRARNALALVGADLDAEFYWLNTINDPAIPANERKDLIEDLNEDGISDPAHPALKDLSLIESRILLIEKLLPSAVDKVNAEAFKEAHKDLVKMRERLRQQ